MGAAAMQAGWSRGSGEGGVGWKDCSSQQAFRAESLLRGRGRAVLHAGSCSVRAAGG